MKKPQPTFDAILEMLDDGAWHTLDDLSSVSRYPTQWAKELNSEGVVELREDPVPIVRLRKRALAGSSS